MAAFPHHEWTSSQGVFSGSVSGVDMNNPAHRPLQQHGERRDADECCERTSGCRRG